MPSNVDKIQIRDLRCRIDINRKVLTPDGIGGNTITYSTIYTVWAMLDDWKGHEHYRAERIEGLVYHQVIIRGSAGVTVLPDDVVVFEGRTMPVKYINSVIDGKLKYIELIVVEGDPIG